MLTKEQYKECLDAHMSAMVKLASVENFKEATVMAEAFLPMTWEVTRPHVNYIEKDVSGYLPDEYRATINALFMVLVVDDDEMEILMAWGRAIDNDGNDIMHSDENADRFPLIPAILDERTLVDYGQYGQKHVKSLDAEVKGPDAPRVDTTHVDNIGASIDDQVEKFSAEVDALFDTWGGGESSG